VRVSREVPLCLPSSGASRHLLPGEKGKRRLSDHGPDPRRPLSYGKGWGEGSREALSGPALILPAPLGHNFCV
jgi:hypothetical protein